MSLEDLRVLLVTDGSADPERIVAVASAARAGGVRAVQVREPALSGADLLRLVSTLRDLFPPGGGTLLVNDRLDVARAAGADGVHLGFRSVRPEEARRLLPGAVVGASVHDPAEARRAEDGGADYVVFGPVFATPSKAGRLEPRGIAALSEAARNSRAPVIAIGGVDASNGRECARAGAFGVACIRALFDARDPASEARALLDAAGGRRP